MTYDLTLERLIDAPPEVVFDTIVDPEAQREIMDDQVPGWELWEWEIDLRVGGTWSFVMGAADRTGEPDRGTFVFTEVDRPRRLSYRSSMFLGQWGRTVEFTETLTFEDRDGKTLLTVRLSDLESEEVRDGFMDGVPEWLDAIERTAIVRVARRSSPSR
ncbi:MAG TPA: SRPBCC domain-containing protein [Actinomycetota bacterium]|nr:SRPBCC domain-containing protein [Actinomycetota bacterium]